ncbi:hypothetical protein GAB14E_0138 [Colwellia psychrerythraea]|uniref:Uncharacterized protein n=1 Tax=Colwellia psychrerythraea TaxID=28229 RepID=A0A099L022_COLPS|nr:hypothetical protein GAB14E_0138 [Colwellia psychrerythraea]
MRGLYRIIVRKSLVFGLVGYSVISDCLTELINIYDWTCVRLFYTFEFDDLSVITTSLKKKDFNSVVYFMLYF